MRRCYRSLHKKNKQIDFQRFKLGNQRGIDVTAIFALKCAAGTDQFNAFAFTEFMANRMAIGEDLDVDVRQLACQIPAG